VNTPRAGLHYQIPGLDKGPTGQVPTFLLRNGPHRSRRALGRNVRDLQEAAVARGYRLLRIDHAPERQLDEERADLFGLAWDPPDESDPLAIRQVGVGPTNSG
jgi:hypothetical protein